MFIGETDLLFIARYGRVFCISLLILDSYLGCPAIIVLRLLLHLSARRFRYLHLF